MNVSIWPCSSCSPPSFTLVAVFETDVAQRAFAFAQVVIASERVFHVLEGAQRGADVAGGGGFLLGGADVLRGLEFTAEENRLRDPSGEAPDDGIERADGVELRGSQSADGAERKARQARGAGFVHAMKRGGEAALGRR